MATEKPEETEGKPSETKPPTKKKTKKGNGSVTVLRKEVNERIDSVETSLTIALKKGLKPLGTLKKQISGIQTDVNVLKAKATKNFLLLLLAVLVTGVIGFGASKFFGGFAGANSEKKDFFTVTIGDKVSKGDAKTRGVEISAKTTITGYRQRLNDLASLGGIHEESHKELMEKVSALKDEVSTATTTSVTEGVLGALRESLDTIKQQIAKMSAEFAAHGPQSAQFMDRLEKELVALKTKLDEFEKAIKEKK